MEAPVFQQRRVRKDMPGTRPVSSRRDWIHHLPGIAGRNGPAFN